MTSYAKRRYDGGDSDDEPDEDYRVMLLAEAGRVPGLEIYPRFHNYKKNKKRKKNKFRKQFGGNVDRPPKRPKIEDTIDDEYIVGRIIGNLNKPSNIKAFQNCLMMSDWLKKLPEDFEDNWIMVPCPRGKRMLVVAGCESTRCYTKTGELLFYFISSLPGGHTVGGDEASRKVTILDCIWHHKSQTYYVLDGLVWNSTHLLECEAQFRFFWLEQKLLEAESISEQTEANDYPFVFLPRFQCNKLDIAKRMEESSFPSLFLESVDGFLFYDKNAPYCPGTTSNVCWLKPFMVPDILQMSVGPELLLDCPDDCISMDKYIEEFEKDKKTILKKERKQRRIRYLEEVSALKAVSEQAVSVPKQEVSALNQSVSVPKQELSAKEQQMSTDENISMQME